MSATLLCLALTVFYEARGEPLLGQEAVAQVIVNRARIRDKSVCEVVTEKGQFTWGVKKHIRKVKDADGGVSIVVDRSNLPVKRAGWSRALRVAKAALVEPAKHAMQNIEFFHATYVSPKWAHQHSLVVKIGNHIFYARARGSPTGIVRA